MLDAINDTETVMESYGMLAAAAWAHPMNAAMNPSDADVLEDGRCA